MRMGGVSCWGRRSADGDHTHALVAQQSHSFPDNLVALLGRSRAWNCSGETARSAIGEYSAVSPIELPPPPERHTSDGYDQGFDDPDLQDRSDNPAPEAPRMRSPVG